MSYVVSSDRGIVLVSGSKDPRFAGFWLGCPKPLVAVFRTRTQARVVADKMMRKKWVAWTEVLELSDSRGFA